MSYVFTSHLGGCAERGEAGGGEVTLVLRLLSRGSLLCVGPGFPPHLTSVLNDQRSRAVKTANVIPQTELLGKGGKSLSVKELLLPWGSPTQQLVKEQELLFSGTAVGESKACC